MKDKNQIDSPIGRITFAELFALVLQDNQMLEVARGYYELKMYTDAEAELLNGSFFTRKRSDYLELRGLIHLARGEFQKSLGCADEIIVQEPDDAMGYILRACAVQHLKDGGARASYKILADVVDKFDDCLSPKYNLGCFAAASGNLRAARKWLIRTFAAAIGTEFDGHYQNLAFKDTDLEPLWRELSRINEAALRLYQRRSVK